MAEFEAETTARLAEPVPQPEPVWNNGQLTQDYNGQTFPILGQYGGDRYDDLPEIPSVWGDDPPPFVEPEPIPEPWTPPEEIAPLYPSQGAGNPAGNWATGEVEPEPFVLEAVPAPEPLPVFEPPPPVAPPQPTNGIVGNPTPTRVPNQFDASLTRAEANAACGPAAAVAFATSMGRNPTIREAQDLAKQYGWTPGGGMNGVQNQVNLLNGMGVPNRLQPTFSDALAQRDVAGGNPVMISTNAHYFVIDGYNPQTNQYHFGNSGSVLLRGGRAWMTIAEMQNAAEQTQLATSGTRGGGTINGVLYLDNEQSPAPSVAVNPNAPTAVPEPDRGYANEGDQRGVGPQAGGLVDYARRAAERAGIDPDLFVRQINQESGFRTDRASPAGAQGIAQIVPRWHPGVNVNNPQESLDYAANLMASHLRTYNGDYRVALAAYNAGPGAVAQYGGVPPFRETQNYIRIIMGGQTPMPTSAPGDTLILNTAVEPDPEAAPVVDAFDPLGASSYDQDTTVAGPPQTGPEAAAAFDARWRPIIEGQSAATTPGSVFEGVRASGNVNAPVLRPSPGDVVGGAIQNASDGLRAREPWRPNPALAGDAINVPPPLPVERLPNEPYGDEGRQANVGLPRTVEELQTFMQTDPEGAQRFMDRIRAEETARTATGDADRGLGGRPRESFLDVPTANENILQGPLADSSRWLRSAIGESIDPQPDLTLPAGLQESDVERRRLRNFVMQAPLAVVGEPFGLLGAGVGAGSAIGSLVAPGLVRSLGGTEEQGAAASMAAGFGPGAVGAARGALGVARGAAGLTTQFDSMIAANRARLPDAPTAELPEIAAELRVLERLRDRAEPVRTGPGDIVTGSERNSLPLADDFEVRTRLETALEYQGRPLWSMSPDELDAAYAAERLNERTSSVRAFGPEEGARYDRLQRTANSTSNPQAADRASDEIAAIEARLSPEQQRILFGIGEPGANAETIREFSRAIGSLDYESPTALGQSLRWAITKVGNGVDPEQMNMTEQLAYATLRHAAEQARGAGWDTGEVTRVAIEAAGDRFPNPNDAMLMLGRYLRPEGAAPQGTRGLLGGGQPGRVDPQLAADIGGSLTGAAGSQIGTDENTTWEERLARGLAGGATGLGLSRAATNPGSVRRAFSDLIRDERGSIRLPGESSGPPPNEDVGHSLQRFRATTSWDTPPASGAAEPIEDAATRLRRMYEDPASPGLRQGFEQRVQQLGTNIIRGMFNDRIDLRQAQNKVEEYYSAATHGAPLPYEAHAVEFDRLSRGAAGRAGIRIQNDLMPAIDSLSRPQQSLLRDAMVLSDNLDKARAIERDFGVEAADARMFPGGLTRQSSQELLVTLQEGASPEDWAAVEKAANRIYTQFVDPLRDRMREAGVWSDELVHALKTEFPHYMESVILEHMDDPRFISPGKKIGLADIGLKHLTETGTSAAREDPFVSLTRMAFEAERRAAKNEAAQAVYMWRQIMPEMADIMRVLKPGEKAMKGEVEMPFFKDGELVRVATSEPIAQAISFMGGPADGRGLRLFGKLMGADLLRMGATERNPIFALGKNPVIDFPTYMIRMETDYGASRTLDIAKAYGEALVDSFKGITTGTIAGPHRQRGYAIGGAQAGIWLSDTATLERWVRHLSRPSAIQEPAAYAKYFLHNPKELMQEIWDATTFKWVADIGSRLEDTPRTAAMLMYERFGPESVSAIIPGGRSLPEPRLALPSPEAEQIKGGAAMAEMPKFGKPRDTGLAVPGPQPYEGVSTQRPDLGAGMAFRNVTQDFAVGGMYTKVLNTWVPFANVAFQAMPWTYKLIKDNPKNAVATLVTLVGAPAIAAQVWNRSDEDRSAAYDDVPDWVKRMGTVVMKPRPWTEPNERGIRRPDFVVIPNRVAQPLAIMARNAVDRVMQTASPDEIEQIAQDMLASASPIQAESTTSLLGTIMPVALGLLTQLGTNRDFFRGGYIDTQARNDRASAAAEWVGEKTPLSGAQVEFAVRETTAGLGGIALAASELAAKLKDGQPIVPHNAGPSELPGVGGLIGSYTRQSGGQTQQDLQQLRDQTQEQLTEAYVSRLPNGSRMNQEQQRVLRQRIHEDMRQVANHTVFGTGDPSPVIRQLERDLRLQGATPAESSRELSQLRDMYERQRGGNRGTSTRLKGLRREYALP